MSTSYEINPASIQPIDPVDLSDAAYMDQAQPVTDAAQTGSAELIEQAVPFRFTLSIYQVLYAVFLMVALGLRLIQLGTIVLNDSEAHEALSVFRVITPNAAGSALIPHAPLMFAANTLIMAIGGSNNLTARLATALVGVLIVMLPYLFRRWIGQTGALLVSGMLALSPVLLTASRTMSGAVWTIALALGALWFVGRFAETRRMLWALAASACVAIMLLASESAGFLVVLMLGGGLLFALLTTDDPDHSIRQRVRETISGWPWLRGLAISVIVLGIVGSVFLLHIDGVGALGDVVSRGLQGFVYRPAFNLTAYPLITSLFYEPVFWLFGLIGAWLTLREDSGFVQRGLIGWLIVAIVVSVVYPGAGAEHALWLTLPLAGLSAIALERILAPVQDQFWQVPIWGPLLNGVGVVATLSIMGINLLYVSRAALSTVPAVIPTIDQPFRILLVFMTLVLLVILYFLVGSIWGSRAAWHGLGIGFLMFLGVYSLGSGWRASVTNADDSRELWRPHPVSQNLTVLNQALLDTSLRASGMPYDMPLSVAWPDDGAVAWMIRNYTKTTFVTETSAALNGPAIIAPKTNAQPQLGAAYVGEPFAVYRTWDRSTMAAWDIFAWAYDRETRTEPAVTDRIVLWVRSDVYGVPDSALLKPAAQ